MNVFELNGKVYVEGNISHQELLNILYKELKIKHGIHFAGSTKDVTGEYIISEKYISEG